MAHRSSDFFGLFEPIINSHPPYSSLGYVAIIFGGFFGTFYLEKRAEKKIRETEERKKLGISGELRMSRKKKLNCRTVVKVSHDFELS